MVYKILKHTHYMTFQKVSHLPRCLHPLLNIRPQRLRPFQRRKMPPFLMCLEKRHIAHLLRPRPRHRRKFTREIRIPGWFLLKRNLLLILTIRIHGRRETATEPIQRNIRENGIHIRRRLGIRPGQKLLANPGELRKWRRCHDETRGRRSSTVHH